MDDVVTGQVDAGSLEPSEANYQQYFPTDYIGPVWQADSNGEFVLPERTIGWHCLAWIHDNLTSFDGEGPFELTAEQSRLILWMYAIDESGKFLYPTVLMQRMKGVGKSPLAAVLCLLELVGPAEFSHYDPELDIYWGKRKTNANVGLGAVAKEQTSAVRDLFQTIIPDRTRKKYGMDVQKEIIYASNSAVLRTYGTSPRAMQGIRLTFFIADECHEYVEGNHGVKFFNTVFDNLSKRGGRLFLPTNAYQPGELSVAERIREHEEKVWSGRAEPSGVLYDSIEAHPSLPMTGPWMQVALPHLRGDATWLTWDNIKSSILSGATPNSLKKRMWHNAIVATEESAFTPGEIRSAIDDSCRGDINDLQVGDEITLGFDGGKTDDATALVAFRLRDKLIVPIAVWERPEGVESWHVDTGRVDSAVHFAFSRFDVKAFFADVSQWESYIDKWSEEFREQLVVKATPESAVGFDMRGHGKRIASNNEFFVGNVRDGGIRFNGSPFMRDHMGNAENKFSSHGLFFRKKGGPESSRKIDCLIAATLAYMGYRELAERKAAKGNARREYKRSHLITG